VNENVFLLFTENGVYMYDAPPPYPGIDPQLAANPPPHTNGYAATAAAAAAAAEPYHAQSSAAGRQLLLHAELTS
jgi:hypothetical protein